MTWQNRILSHGEESPEQLLGHPLNARIHPLAQQQAVASMLDEIGWVAEVIVNRRTGFIVDGHLRVAEAISRGELTVPCTYVELSDVEERKVLAFYDATTGMAVVDPSTYIQLTEDLEIPGPLAGLHAELGQIEEEQLPGGGEGDGEQLPQPEMAWGYATWGKTRIECATAEVDALEGLWEAYQARNEGDGTGFVRWLVDAAAEGS